MGSEGGRDVSVGALFALYSCLASVCAKLRKSGYVRVVFVENVGLLLGGGDSVVGSGNRFVSVGCAVMNDRRCFFGRSRSRM